MDWRTVRVGLVLALLAGCEGPSGGTGGSSSTQGDTSTGAGMLSASTDVAPTSSSGARPTTSSETGGSSSGAGEVSTGSSSSSSSSSSTGGESSSTGEGPVGPIAVVNPGFEVDDVGPGSYDDTIVPFGWTRYDPQSIIGQDYNSLGVLNPTGTVLYPDGAPEGSKVALVFLWRDQTSGMPAGYVQTLGDALQANTHYSLRVKVGNIAPEVNAAYDLAGFPGYRVELLAGDVVLAADDDTLAPADGMFAQSEVSFTTAADDPALGQPLAIRLINLNKADAGIEVNFDDVQLDAAPSP